MRQFFLLAMLGALSSNYGQIRFEPGYFIDNTGQRTDCLIRNADWFYNPDHIVFKTAEDGGTQTAHIQDIAEFKTGAMRYVRVTLDIDQSAVTVSRLSTSKLPEWATMTVFLKVLVEGEVTLYEYNTYYFHRFFLKKPPMVLPEQLVYKSYLSSASDISENKTYRQQLLNHLSDRLADQDFSKVRYTTKDLVRLVARYNGVTPDPQAQAVPKTTILFKLLAGAASGRFKGNRLDTDGYLDAKGVLRGDGGLEVEFLMPFNRNKWSFYSGIQYHSSESEGHYFRDNGSKHGYQLKYNAFEIPIGVRHYVFLKARHKLFVDGSFQFVMPSGEYRFKGVVSGELKRSFSNTSALSVGAGYNTGPIWIRVFHTFPHGLLSSGQTWVIESSATGLLLGYKLF